MAAAFLGQLYKALAEEAQSGVGCFTHLAPGVDENTVNKRSTFLASVCREARQVLAGSRLSPILSEPSSSLRCTKLYTTLVAQYAEVL